MERMLALQEICMHGNAVCPQLLNDLFEYSAPYLRNAELTRSVTSLYNATLCLLSTLLQNFPEFLCDYYYGFCDIIPLNRIEIRNLILSAFPRVIKLPNKFKKDSKVDMPIGIYTILRV